jgi:uncharacterized membrane protein (UPF0127 family)
MGARLSPRIKRLPTAVVLGRQVRVATGLPVRLLGLSRLDREEAGEGLLIPRCSSVHTFGMRFPLDLWFLDAEGAVLLTRQGVPSRRLASCRHADAVLEIPAGEGGEISPPAP